MAQIVKKLWDKAGRKRIPLTGAFELLPICNLSCKMCYVRKTPKEVEAAGGLMPTDFWLRVVDEAMAEGLLFPLITGGEPFLRQDFQEIYAGMIERNLQVSINTNGTLIDESMAKWLGTHKPVRINMTLYGASEESYQQLCGNGEAFSKVRKAVECLKKYHVPVKFNTSITPYNVHELDQMMAYAHSVDSPIEVAAYMFPPVRRDAGMIGENDRLSPESAGETKVRADYLQNNEKWFMAQVKRYSYFRPVSDEMLKNQASEEGREMGCRAGRCAFWVDWQGNIGNCGMYAAIKASLKKLSFRQAWQEIVNETNQIKYSPVCTNCPNYWLCHACIAMVYNESGSKDGRPEYICRMTEAAAKSYERYAHLLSEGKNPLDNGENDIKMRT